MKRILTALLLLVTGAAVAEPGSPEDLAWMRGLSALQALDIQGDIVRRAEKGEILLPPEQTAEARASHDAKVKYWQDYVDGLRAAK